MNNATTTCTAPDASGTYQCLTAYGFSTSTDQSVVNGFTYGEVVIGTLLTLILLVDISILYFLHFRKVKVKN